MKLRTAVRTGDVSPNAPPPRVKAKAIGACTPNCRKLPRTDPHARYIANASRFVCPPYAMSVPIIAAFHATGAVYESRNLPWLLRTPRHQADVTSNPAPGKR